jgi:hypothetical protein
MAEFNADHADNAASPQQRIRNKINRFIGNIGPIENKHKSALQSIIRTVYPNLHPHKRARLYNLASQNLGPSLSSILPKNARYTSEMLTQLQEIVNPYEGNAALKRLAELRDQVDREFVDNASTANSESQAQGKITLRSRFHLPSETDGLETPEQQVSDSVQSDLFSFPSTLPENGLNNALFLQNCAHDYFTQKHPLAPRPIAPPQVTMPFESLLQDSLDMDIFTPEDVYDKFGLAVAKSRAARANGAVTFLNDSEMRPAEADVQGVTYNPFIPVMESSGAYRRDPNLPMPQGFENYLGFKPLTDTWREPLKPARGPYGGAYRSPPSKEEGEFDLLKMYTYGPLQYPSAS